MDSPAFFPHYWNIPRTLTVFRGEKKKKSLELGFARSVNRTNVNLKTSADTYSLMMEVFIVWWLFMCYLHHSDVPASRAHAWWGTWDTISTELRMSSQQELLGAAVGRCMISASWAQISIECFSGVLWTHKLGWWYLWLFSTAICCMVHICLVTSY